jgi:tripartite-type tricarboxylate transporter receptor subunit TctC
VKALAVTSGQRSVALPNVPTLAESGLTGFDISTWFGLMAPAGTPADVIAKLQKEVASMLQTADMRATLLATGAEPVGGTPQQMAMQIQDEVRRFSALAQKIRLALE